MRLRLRSLLLAFIVFLSSLSSLAVLRVLPAQLTETVAIQGVSFRSAMWALFIIGLGYSLLHLVKGLLGDEGKWSHINRIASGIYTSLILGFTLAGSDEGYGSLVIRSTAGGADNTLIIRTGFFPVLLILTFIALTSYSVYQYAHENRETSQTGLME